MRNCIFCKIAPGQEKSWKDLENDPVFALFDIHTASKYHTLVIPKNHHENIFHVPEEV